MTSDSAEIDHWKEINLMINIALILDEIDQLSKYNNYGQRMCHLMFFPQTIRYTRFS
ncbi:hypothetical protein [Candidatus Lokiarchaeum ossiferum]|uniref:hypothetical protein n=1 Tax=Candidatus Lokiarchaeum ossiferum TaxID=2951803 RepID=UPI00352FD9DF